MLWVQPKAEDGYWAHGAVLRYSSEMGPCRLGYFPAEIVRPVGTCSSGECSPACASDPSGVRGERGWLSRAIQRAELSGSEMSSAMDSREEPVPPPEGESVIY